MTRGINNKELAAKAAKALLNGGEVLIHKAGVGKVRENCVYAEKMEDVPSFLVEDGAICVNGDTITLHAVDGPADRSFPVYICWEEVSEVNSEKVPGKYGSWPKDNGATTLKVVDGKCYNLPAMVKATLITEVVPDWVREAGFPVEREGDTWKLTRTDWGGEVRCGVIREALGCEYGKGDVNILALDEKSAEEYIVTIEGEDVGVLTDLIG